jgi:hypothetical protein
MDNVKDLAERTIATAVEAFLAVWVTTGDVEKSTFAAAGVAAILAAAKYGLKRVAAWRSEQGDL